MKILYSLNNSIDSQIFLSRFLPNIKNHNIKICMHGLSKFFNVDLNLNFFLNEKKKIDIHSERILELSSWIKNFNPDIVISDNEAIVGYTASVQNYKSINCSYNFIFFEQNSALMKKTEFKKKNKELINMFFNNKSFCPSIIVDFDFSPKLPVTNFGVYTDMTYIRPYYIIGDKTENKKTHSSVLNIHNATKDSYYYNLFNSKLYADSIKSSDYNLIDASHTTITDSFYNKKYCYFNKPNESYQKVLIDFCRLNKIGELYKDILKFKDINCLELSKEAKYLHEIIEEI